MKWAHAAGQELQACFLSPGKLQSAHQPGIARIWRGGTQRPVDCIRRLGVGPGVGWLCFMDWQAQAVTKLPQPLHHSRSLMQIISGHC